MDFPKARSAATIRHFAVNDQAVGDHRSFESQEKRIDPVVGGARSIGDRPDGDQGAVTGAERVKAIVAVAVAVVNGDTADGGASGGEGDVDHGRTGRGNRVSTIGGHAETDVAIVEITQSVGAVASAAAAVVIGSGLGETEERTNR